MMSRAPREQETEEAHHTRVVRELGRFVRDPHDVVELWNDAALAHVLDPSGAPISPRVSFDVSAGFAVTGILAGLPFGTGGPLFVTLALFTVVVVPELARAALLRSSGRSAFVFVSPGGATTEMLGRKLDGARRGLLAVAGPLANLAVAALVACVGLRTSGTVAAAAHLFALWHAGWGLAQVLPLAPFAVGVALQARWRGSRAVVHQAFSTKVVLLAGLVVAKVFPSVFPVVMLAGSGAVHGFVRCYQAAVDEKNGLVAAAGRAETLIAEGEATAALRLVRGALSRVRAPKLRVRLWKCLAWAAIGKGDAFVAHGALGTLPARELDVHLVVSYLAACSRLDEAIGLLERARAAGQRTRETTKLLLDLLLRYGEVVRARRIAREDMALLTRAEMELVERTIFGARDGVEQSLRT
jgi:hypothetical protein